MEGSDNLSLTDRLQSNLGAFMLQHHGSQEKTIKLERVLREGSVDNFTQKAQEVRQLYLAYIAAGCSSVLALKLALGEILGKENEEVMQNILRGGIHTGEYNGCTQREIMEAIEKVTEDVKRVMDNPPSIPGNLRRTDLRQREELELARDWLRSRGIGRRIGQEALEMKLKDRKRSPEIFPMRRGLAPFFGAVFGSLPVGANPLNDMPRMIASVEFLEYLVATVAGANSFQVWLNFLIRYDGNIVSYRETGVTFKGDLYEPQQERLSLPEHLHGTLPKAFELIQDTSVMFFYMLQALFRILGFSNLNPVNKEDRQTVLQYLLSQDKVDEIQMDERSKSWIRNFFKNANTTFAAEELYAQKKQARAVPAVLTSNPIGPKAIEKAPEPVIELMPSKVFVELSKSFKPKGVPTIENLALTEECRTNARYIPGQIKGEVQTKRLNRPEIVSLYISRPNPKKIIYPGNIASEGHFVIEFGRRKYRLPWEMDEKGALTFLMGSECRTEADFRNPDTKNFYQEMRRAVLLGLKDLLTADIRMEAPEPGAPRSSRESTDANPDGRRRYLKVHTMLERLAAAGKDKEGEGTELTQPPSLNLVRLSDLMKKITRGELIGEEDLKELDFYVAEETDGTVVYLLMDPIAALRRLITEPGARAKIYVCLRGGMIKRAGYAGHTSGDTRYAVASIPSPESQKRLTALVAHLKLDEPQPEMPPYTTVNIRVGPNPDEPTIRRIVLGSKGEVDKYRATQPNQCLVVGTSQLMDWHAGYREGLPTAIHQVQMGRSKRSGAWHISTVLQVPQLPQFDQGHFISIERALAC